MCLGIPGQIVAINSEQQKLATVDVGGVRRTVNIACIVDDRHPPESCIGEWVLVHVGFAIAKIDETEAALTLAAVEKLGDVYSEELEAFDSSSII